MSGSKEGTESNLEITTKPLAAPAASGTPVRRVTRNRSGPLRGVTRNRSGPLRGVTRNRSGPMTRSVARNRSGGGVIRGVSRNKSGPLRGVRRTPSITKAVPLKAGSFQRSVPDRTSSTSSLRKLRRQRNGSPPRPDDMDASVVSNNTMDSIMVRKKQFSCIPNVAVLRSTYSDDEDTSLASSFLDESLRTVDSMVRHQMHLERGGNNDDCDMSVFSESFVSTTTYCLSDYEEDDPSLTPRGRTLDIDMSDMKITEKSTEQIKAASDVEDDEFGEEDPKERENS